MYNQFNNRKDWQLMEGERVYFNFRQKNYVRRELFNCENEYSGNPALVWWRNFWQMEGSGGMVNTHRLVWWLPGGGCASGSRSRTLTWFVLLETCRESFSESDLLQEAGYTQNIFKMRKKLFLVWGHWKCYSDLVIRCHHNLLSQSAPWSSAGCIYQLLNDKNSFRVVLHLAFF